MPPRLCPVCALPLTPRSVSSRYGASLLLDRCPSCRGIWLDRNELYQIGAAGIEDLAGAAVDAAGEGTCALPAVAACPACGDRLMGLSGAGGLPGVAHACYCNGCGGFWLDERDLVAFGRERASRLAAIQEGEKARLAQAAREAKANEIFQDRYPAESPSERGFSDAEGAGAAATVAGAALSALAPGPVGPLVIAGLTIAERLVPFIADLVVQNLEAAKDDGRALPKSPKRRGGPRNRK